MATAKQTLIPSESLASLAALQPVVEGSLGFQCALNVIIASELHLLSRLCKLTNTRREIILTVKFSKLKANFARTDKVLNRLIRSTIQSGFFTAVFALGTLLSSRFSPTTSMISLFALPIERIYAHTMMDHLISREQLRNILSSGGSLISAPNFAVAGHGSGAEIISLRTTSSPSTASKNPETGRSNHYEEGFLVTGGVLVDSYC
ncbi:hypothetical protein B0H17DRAFT_1200496 [Mycena rosella]|uniref:DUF6534 domain-containing protein n=1 Tax=Mycena rosella TaxID=1033263 RepID=A0AAD7DJN9_MYCRO|nr:hypothetical protein B0H17DRAFT_1200496 [Mycena rosella]